MSPTKWAISATWVMARRTRTKTARPLRLSARPLHPPIMAAMTDHRNHCFSGSTRRRSKTTTSTSSLRPTESEISIHRPVCRVSFYRRGTTLSSAARFSYDVVTSWRQKTGPRPASPASALSRRDAAGRLVEDFSRSPIRMNNDPRNPKRAPSNKDEDEDASKSTKQHRPGPYPPTEDGSFDDLRQVSCSSEARVLSMVAY